MCPCGDSVLVSQVTIETSEGGLKVDRCDDDDGSRMCGMKRLRCGTFSTDLL